MCELLGKPQAVTVEGTHSWLIVDPDAFGEVITNVVDLAAYGQELARRDAVAHGPKARGGGGAASRGRFP